MPAGRLVPAAFCHTAFLCIQDPASIHFYALTFPVTLQAMTALEDPQHFDKLFQIVNSLWQERR